MCGRLRRPHIPRPQFIEMIRKNLMREGGSENE